MQDLRVVFTSLKSGMHIIKCMLKASQSWFCRFLHGVHGLCWRTRLRDRWFGYSWVRISVHQGVSGGSTLDLSKTNQVASFEVAVAMLKFPERRFGGQWMKYVANWEGCQRWSPPKPNQLYLCESHTYWVGEQRRICSYAWNIGWKSNTWASNLKPRSCSCQEIELTRELLRNR